MKFVYIRPRSHNGVFLSNGGMTLAIQQRSSDGRVLVAMAKCPDHKVFDERKGRREAQARFNAECYAVMTLEAVAKYVDQPVESLKEVLATDPPFQ